MLDVLLSKKVKASRPSVPVLNPSLYGTLYLRMTVIYLLVMMLQPFGSVFAFILLKFSLVNLPIPKFLKIKIFEENLACLEYFLVVNNNCFFTRNGPSLWRGNLFQNGIITQRVLKREGESQISRRFSKTPRTTANRRRSPRLPGLDHPGWRPRGRTYLKKAVIGRRQYKKVIQATERQWNNRFDSYCYGRFLSFNCPRIWEGFWFKRVVFRLD